MTFTHLHGVNFDRCSAQPLRQGFHNGPGTGVVREVPANSALGERRALSAAGLNASD